LRYALQRDDKDGYALGGIFMPRPQSAINAGNSNKILHLAALGLLMGMPGIGLAADATASTAATTDAGATATAATAADTGATTPGAPAATGSDTLEAVVVTGSLLAIDGAHSPTPVTVVTADQLATAAPGTLTEGLLQLPLFKGSPSAQSQGTGTTSNNGASYLNLRGLGTQRTLVLLDGRRVVSATSAGSVDIEELPEALISQVEVVTGGASAAYGSDAVAGVVNFRLDTKFTGVKGSLEYGQSDYNDDKNYKASIAAGDSFFDDRLHIVASLEHYDNKGVDTSNRRPWAYDGTGAIPNPAVTPTNPASPTNPAQIVVQNPYSSVAALGGLITNTALRGTTFGPGGTPQQFQYGSLVSPTLMQGGGGYNPSLQLVLQPDQSRTAAFTHATFDVNSSFRVFVEAMLATNDLTYHSLPTFELSSTAFTIFKDNAYLPASIAAVMNNPAAPINSVTVGRVSPDFAIPELVGTSELQRYVVGFDGDINSDWTYKGYFQHGQNHSLFKTEDDPISNNLYQAADAVFNSSGQIVCRSTLTHPTNGCVPLNIFGYGSASAAALSYITGTAIQDVTVKEDVAEGSVSGKVLALPAGELEVAAGVGWRKEQFDQETDAISQEIRTGDGIDGFPTGLVNTLGGFERTNPQPSSGAYSVKEAFGEVNAPLLKDITLVKSLTMNGAVRFTDYSLSGSVTSWKVGLVYEPVSGFRLRGTRSRDIRAPNLGELFQGSSQGTASVIDPAKGGLTYTSLTGAVGNTSLVPEISDTTVLGFVLQPDALPNFMLSLDHYDIKIKDAIAALTAQQEVTLCGEGATELCSYIERGAGGLISRVELPYLNVAERTTSGFDLESSYSIALPTIANLGATSLTFHALVNFLDDFTTAVQGAPPIQLAGDIGVNSTPKWSGNLSATLASGPISLFAQERVIGEGQFDNTLSPSQISYNHVPTIRYTDLTASYDLSSFKGTVFFTVNNLMNTDPPQIPGILIAGSSLGNHLLYYVVGRAYTAGIRFKF
jgi:iron complex outermembrane receptor protein